MGNAVEATDALPEIGEWRAWFQNSVDEVMALFKEGDFEDNRALSPLFLLGYSCQRRESMRKTQEASQKSKEN